MKYPVVQIMLFLCTRSFWSCNSNRTFKENELCLVPQVQKMSLDKSDVALSILKEIRKRAGIEAGADGKYGIAATTREEIREAVLAERNIEFCFEGHSFWDLRRLRMLDRLDGKTKHGVESIALNADGTEMPISEAKTKARNSELTEKDFKYGVLQIPFTGVKVSSVPEKYYFFPIKQSVIDLNSKIEQNSNWGGTFNPTLE